ncbi:MAG: hypothetical protein DSY42_01095 [Aquifex sp.]|nr:MAG: hypothetical protein DSY42_01095 [Aquifex sp.]
MSRVKKIERTLVFLNNVLLIILIGLVIAVGFSLKDRVVIVVSDFPVKLKVLDANLKAFVLRKGEIIRVNDINPLVIYADKNIYILGYGWKYEKYRSKDYILYLIRKRLEYLRGRKI